MNGKADAIDQLNRLLQVVYRSFAMYLADASPWASRRDERAVEALENVIADQRAASERIGAAILDRGGRVEPGEYPSSFTDVHFLSLDFLLRELQYYQRRDIAEIGEIVASLEGDREAKELAEEMLGAERAHLEAIESAAAQPA